MKKFITLCLILFTGILAVPLLAVNLNGFSFKNVGRSLSFGHGENIQDEDELLYSEQSAKQSTVKVMASASGEIITTDEIDYIVGCVACEMPPSFEEEALKAQAVAAYTNLMRMKANPDASLGGADISDSPSVHQGYYSEAQRREKWGEKYEQYSRKITNCVRQVSGEVITFDGKPIVAAYCAVSPGRTEDAAVIWSGSLPYLRSVASPGDTLSPDCASTLVLSEEQFRNAVSADSEIQLGDNPSEWIKNIERSENGTDVIRSVTIGNKTVSGNTARQLLGLRSPSFTVGYCDGSFTFETRGYGHCVGMSQYGANYMAQTGSTYRDILTHYYTGVKIEQVKPN